MPVHPAVEQKKSYFNIQHRGIMNLLILVLNCICFATFECARDCGFPGHSKKSSLEESSMVVGNASRKYFRDGEVVRYECTYGDAPLIVGSRERRCEDGHWSKSIPKCGKD